MSDAADFLLKLFKSEHIILQCEYSLLFR